MMADWTRGFIVIPAIALMAGCGGEDAAVASDVPVEAGAAPAVGAAVAPAADGEVIEVMMTMENGGSFEPSEITAKPGDVLRFINVDNVHNVSFPAAKNPGASNLPAPSAYLTTPGSSFELPVALSSGSYTFQCDPHAAMGMIGTLTVQ